jgi:fructose transport system permease protein
MNSTTGPSGLQAAEAAAETGSSPSAPADFDHPTSIGARVHDLLHARATLGPSVVLLASIVLFSVWADRFLETGNFSLIIQQVMVVGAIAIGQTVVVLTAGVDLSVGWLMSLSMLTMAVLSKNGTNGVVALAAGVVVGLVAGLLNGSLVTKLNLPPFIVTLATLFIFKTMTQYVSDQATVRGEDMSRVLLWTGNTFELFGTKIPYGAVLMLVLFAVMGFALRNTAWGRHIYATGDDMEAARLAGIRTKRVLVSAYAVAGVLCAIAGWILIGRIAGAPPNSGDNDYNLDSITAVVIGGTSLFGGRGRVVGTLLGVLTVGLFRNGLTLAGVDDIWQGFAVGVLILVAVSIDQWTRKVTS